MNIYIDAGFYRGITLRRYVDNGIIDKTWKIYVFEPNTDLNAKQHIADFFGDLPVKLIEKAVWTKNEKVHFHIAGREDAASVEGTSGHDTPKEITVDAVDFSKWVAKLPDAYIIMSCDVEGAEFTVLPKMIKDGTIDKIDILEIEFHHRLMTDYTPDDARKLIKEVEKHGVEVKLKDALE